MKRLRRVLLWSLPVLLLVVTLFGAWLIHSESGLRFIAQRALSAVPELQLKNVSGSLADGLQVQALEYDDASIHISATDVHAALRLWPLMRGEFGLSELNVNQIGVVLKVATTEADAKSNTALTLPNLHIDALSVAEARIEGLTEEALFARDVSARIEMGGSSLRIDALKTHDDEFQAQGNIALDLTSLWLVQTADLNIRSRNDAASPLEARLQRAAKGRSHPVTLTMIQPLRATLTLQPGKKRDDLVAELVLPVQDLSALAGANFASTRLNASVRKSGDNLSIEAEADVGAKQFRVLQSDIQWQQDAVNIRALALQWADYGQIDINGLLPFAAQADIALTMSTKALNLPIAEQPPLQIVGRVDVSGTRALPLLKPELQLHQDGLPDGAMTGTLAMTESAFVIDELDLRLPKGAIKLSGEVSRSESSEAQLSLQLDAFDPSFWLQDWPGQIGGSALWRGSLTDQGWNGELSIDPIDGQLRGLPLHIAGSMRVQNNALRQADIAARLGDANLLIDGDLAQGQALKVSLQVPDAALLGPGYAGAASIVATRDQEWTLDAQAKDLVIGEIKIAAAQIQGSISDATNPDINLQAKIEALSIGGASITRADIALSGNQAAHVLQFDVISDQGNLELHAQGGYSNGIWNGVLEQADIDLLADRKLSLQQAVALQLGSDTNRISDACWQGTGDARFCVQLDQRDGVGTLIADIPSLPLGWFSSITRASGYALDDARLSGHASLGWDPSGLTQAQMKLKSEMGRLLIVDRADLLLGYRDLDIDIEFDGREGQAKASANLLPEGRADAQFTLFRSAAGQFGYDGNISVLVRQLDAIEAFTTEITNPEGQINGQFRLQQDDVNGFRIGGAVVLSEFKASVPSLGLTLKNGSVALAGVPEGLVLRGALQSGDGTLTIDGRWQGSEKRVLNLMIAGKDVRLSNTPELVLTASPDLSLTRNGDGWTLQGSLDIPSARIQADQLTGGTTHSADVVVVDDPPDEYPAERWHAQIDVRLGDEVRLKGFGFDGKLNGQLKVRQSSGRSATASGQLRVTGLYNAYGQKLTIERGEILYAGGRLDEPSLNVLAERKVGDHVAGIAITGTARRAISRVYARPGLPESEALALLVTGRPLRDVRGGDRNRLSGAALALGTIGGDMLAKNLGLDELGVSSNSGLQGEAFTIGKYLSPRLYVGYGIGLLTRGEVFTVRYMLRKNIELEANIGERQRASINYRIER